MHNKHWNHYHHKEAIAHIQKFSMFSSAVEEVLRKSCIENVDVTYKYKSIKYKEIALRVPKIKVLIM